MKRYDKQLIQTAGDIQTQLRKQQNFYDEESDRLSALVTVELERLKNLQKNLETCRRRSWQAAGKQSTTRLLRIIRDFPPVLDGWERTIERAEVKLPTLRELVEDLVQIQQEFGRLEINRTEATLSVFTDAIVLEEIYLGDFEIRLNWTALSCRSDSNALQVIALDPHPAAGNESVTHPHVSDDAVCLGDAAATVQNALTSGRLCDALLLVKSVLETYNPSSPYVALSKWSGTPCQDCGVSMDEEDGYYCEQCQHDFCSECVETFDCCDMSYCHSCKITCSDCEESCCPRCSYACSDCGEKVCGNCLKTCEACGNTCCTECMTETYCPTCNEERNLENEEEINESETNDIEQPVAAS